MDKDKLIKLFNDIDIYLAKCDLDDFSLISAGAYLQKDIRKTLQKKYHVVI